MSDASPEPVAGATGSSRARRTRRTPAIAVIVCAVGGLLVLLASGRQWAHTILLASGGRSALSVAGHDVEPSLPALALATLALAAGILAASGWLRRVVGVLVVVVGAAMTAAAVVGRGHVSAALEHREVGVQGLTVHAGANGWWLLAAVGGALTVVAGALTVLRSHAWSALGARYEPPVAVADARAREAAPAAEGHASAAAPPKDAAAATWDALDRGEDPTDRPTPA